MAFTNVWDTAFPPDTQLANLLGQDLRNFRLDTQQRMGSISGLDAAKPPFNTDAQPANWNGVLFFATDTGRIYQWVSPNWIDVTSAFFTGGSLFKSTVIVNHTGTVTVDPVYNFATPTFGVTTGLRIRYAFQKVAQNNAPGTAVYFTYGGVATQVFGFDNGALSPVNCTFFVGEVEFINKNNLNAQSLISKTNAGVVLFSGFGASSLQGVAFATGAPSTAGISIKNGTNTDNQNFFMCEATLF